MLLVRAGPFPLWRNENLPPGCTLFIPFQDPANVGGVIRSAAAFGVTQVVLLREAAHPFHPRSTRAAGSALFRIPLQKGPSIKDLKESRHSMITLSPEGADITNYEFPDRFGLLPGMEGPGLPQNVQSRTSLSIPMVQGVESLNAAMATGIALYQWRNSLK